MKRKINCKQANEIPIMDYLASINHHPKRIVNQNQFWFLSPLRNEKTASFKVDKTINRWFDFGSGKGGNLVDLTLLLHDLKSVSEALEKIETHLFFFHQQNNSNIIESDNPKTAESQNATILEIKDIRNLGYNTAITEYLHSRNIDIQKASNYLKEVYYFANHKHYFGVGFQNNSGGREIRNKYFKGCLGNKDLTTIENNNDSIAVFEGFFDFISANQLGFVDSKSTDILVLNSNALLDRSIVFLENKKAVNLYLDNDDSGSAATAIITNHINCACDQRSLYANAKDINELLARNALSQNQKPKAKLRL